MKTLLLIILMPFAAVAQEHVLAIRINNLWIPQIDFVENANAVRPAESHLSYDTAFLDTAYHCIQIGDWSAWPRKTDRLLYNIVGDTMYTMVDIYSNVFLMMCETNDCCLTCKKTTDGKCNCDGSICTGGKCDERTYGISDIPGIGLSNAIRANLN